MNSLTVGNVVSAGLRIYRDRFAEYFRIALIGYFWVLVPIYGWAKFAAMNGLLARLAFREVIEKPETAKEARRYTKPRMWQFLGAGILAGLIIFSGVLVSYLVLAAVAIGVIAIISPAQGNFDDSNLLVFGILGILAILIGIFLFFIVTTWLVSRYLVVELPIAVEDGVGAGAAIGRSWNLTKGSVIRLQLIVFVAFLISLPISIVIQVASFVLQMIAASLAAAGNDTISSLFAPLFILLIYALALASSALILPFWQAIKAVIYYDLRVRKEGLGMELEEN
ncbi:MAG TPA: DUF975 domain-containing protein [Xenococcaceae cyanobacterium]|jgi:hypothetical protein